MSFSQKPTVQHDFDVDECLSGACAVFGVSPRELHIIAPAVVRVASLMPVKAYPIDDPVVFTATKIEMINEESVHNMLNYLMKTRRLHQETMRRWWQGAYIEATASGHISIGDPVMISACPPPQTSL